MIARRHLRENFRATLCSELQVWGDRFGRNFAASDIIVPDALPWSFIRVSLVGELGISQSTEYDWMEVVKAADELAATEIVCIDPDHDSIWLGRLNKARYWTQAHAKLVSRRIIWEHLDFLSGRGKR